MTGAARALPSGTVCFLFADVESSTALLRSLGEARWAPLLAQVQAIVRAAAERSGGFVVSTEGDGAFVAFASAVNALRAAADAQRQLATADWGGHDLRVRMGMHVGTGIQPRDGDYVALAVHQAARVAAAANGGQVLVTESVVAEGGSSYATDLGLFSVRDFDGPVRLFELVGAGESRSPRVPPAFDTQVPSYRHALVGRDREIEDVVERLHSAALVSLVGPSGIGKTRLAVAVLSQLSADLHAGPWFVDLTAAHEPASVGEVVATAVGCPPGVEIGAHLDALLDGRRGVMVLDHCQHLLDAARAVSLLLTDWCPSLQIVATSTVPLGVPREVVVAVGPLALPASAAPADVLDSASGRLFVERATRQDGLDVSSSATVIDRLCRAVHGVPLAVELVAAMFDPSDPDVLAERLGSGSLDDVMVAATQRLTVHEVDALGALTLVEPPIGDRLAAAALVASGVAPAEVAGVLERLVRSSLLRLDPDGRHSMLVTVRAHLACDDELHSRVVPALLDACTEVLADAAGSLSRIEPVAATAAMLLREEGLPAYDRQRLASELAPWWTGRLGHARARELLLDALALDPSGPGAAALHMAVAATYPPGSETVDTEWHVQRAAVLLGEHDTVDPALVERLKDTTARARRDESS